MANNMSRRHLIRGNYVFVAPCSLLAQKLVTELYGLHCVQMIRPYLSISAAYLARRKPAKSKFYSGLVEYIKKDVLEDSLPRALEVDLQRLKAQQLMDEGNYDSAKKIFALQVSCCGKIMPFLEA